MDKKHWIVVENRQSAGGHHDRTKLEAPCGYVCKDGAIYLLYEETAGVRATIKLQGGKVTLLRGNTRLELEEGRRCHCQYDAGCGFLALETEAKSIRADFRPDGGVARLNYDLWSAGQLLSHNAVTIRITEQRFKPDRAKVPKGS